MDLQGRLILWWLLLTRYAGFRQMPRSTGKLTQCLIQGDSPRKQYRQGRERSNVSITLLGIIKEEKKNGIQGESGKLHCSFLRNHCFFPPHPKKREEREGKINGASKNKPTWEKNSAQNLSCASEFWGWPAQAKHSYILRFLDGVPFDAIGHCIALNEQEGHLCRRLQQALLLQEASYRLQLYCWSMKGNFTANFTENI